VSNSAYKVYESFKKSRSSGWIRSVQELLKLFNCKISFKVKCHNGFYINRVNLFNRTIYICRDDSSFDKILCHELAHLWCFDNNIFFKFHHNPQAYRQWLRAERYVDCLGAILYKTFFNKNDYVFGYTDSDIVAYASAYIYGGENE
jgi:hypothetical protein